MAALRVDAESQNAALNVLQQGDVKTAARHGDTFDARPLVRRVDRLDARQLAGGLKHCGVDGEQCPLRVCLPVHLPRLAKGEEQAAGIKTGEVCRLLQRQARQFANSGKLKQLFQPEAGPPEKTSDSPRIKKKTLRNKVTASQPTDKGEPKTKRERLEAALATYGASL